MKENIKYFLGLYSELKSNKKHKLNKKYIKRQFLKNEKYVQKKKNLLEEINNILKMKKIFYSFHLIYFLFLENKKIKNNL